MLSLIMSMIVLVLVSVIFIVLFTLYKRGVSRRGLGIVVFESINRTQRHCLPGAWRHTFSHAGDLGPDLARSRLGVDGEIT
jgi:hypothetical protein